MIVGPAMPRPITLMWPGACAFASSSSRIAWWLYGAPPPPYSFGQVRRGVAGVAELAAPLAPPVLEARGAAAAAADVLGQVRGDPRAHLVAEGGLFWRVAKLHRLRA